MYRQEDLDIVLNHKSDVTIIWQGCDTKDLTTEWAEHLYRFNHIAISHWGIKALKKKGINAQFKAITATKKELNIQPKGDCVYIYSSNLSRRSKRYHGDHFIKEIRQRTGLEVIRTTLTSYSKEDLLLIYQKCFINLRLTRFDGCPNTNLEMGLMGIKSIFNGNIPHSIKWKNIDDICQSIMSEYDKRHENTDYVAKDIFNFIDEL